MNLRSTILIAVTLAVLSPLRLPAPLYQDGYDDAAAKALAAQYSPSVGRLLLNDSGTTFSVSGVFLNSHWFLTSAHAFKNYFGDADVTILGIYQGSTNGGPVSVASQRFIHPAYDGTHIQPDCALVYVSNGVPAATLVLASASQGEVVPAVGFGIFGTLAGGLFVQDNDARGWRAVVAPGTYGGYSSTYYQSAFFTPDGLYLNGRGLNGDSGSPVFNSVGQLVGIAIGSGGGASAYGSTEFLRLTQPDVLNWIQSIITPVEPQIVSLTATNADVQLVWQGKGGSNYVVQASAALGGTNTFTDLSGVIALPGAGPVLTNFLDPGALTNHNSRFYRIRLQ